MAGHFLNPVFHVYIKNLWLLPNGQLTRLWDQKSDGTILYDAAYQYDGVGNVVTETINGKTSVTSRVYGAEPTFDINGPGLSPNQELFVSENVDMTYTADNRLATYNGSEVVYDADGNMIVGPLQGSIQSYQYDSRNRLIEAGGVSYGYNSENIRTSVTANGITTNYVVNPNAILSQVLMEKDAAGQTKAWYVYGLGLIGREDSAGNYLSYHYDRRGSTIALIDVTEQVSDTYSYGIYGESLEHQGTTDQPFRYNGRDGIMTDSNGLYYMRARYYNPEIKRFVNRDVVTGTISSSQTLNRYAYVNGNPISYVDPFGLSRDGDSVWLQAASFFADSLPGIGTLKGFQQAFTGRDYVTGEYLSVADRWAEGVGSTLSLIPIPGLKHLGTFGFDAAVDASNKFIKGTGKLSPKNYPNPDPDMSVPPVRYEPKSFDEVVRMRQGKGPTTKATHGTQNIEAHHRQQIPVQKGGILDELEQNVHRGPGNPTRHKLPSNLTPAQRAKEIREHWKKRGNEYMLPGEGI